MNLYGYVKNNPYRYRDPNGLCAIPFVFIPALEISFAGAVSWVSMELIIGAVVSAAVGVGFYQIDKAINEDNQDISLNNEAIEEEVEAKTKKKRNSPPPTDPEAEGTPHTIIEKPGQTGQYTTHNGDGTYKQYQGEGKPHGNIPRPNIKENKCDPSPNGPKIGGPEVRTPRPEEIPNIK